MHAIKIKELFINKYKRLHPANHILFLIFKNLIYNKNKISNEIKGAFYKQMQFKKSHCVIAFRTYVCVNFPPTEMKKYF